MPIFDQGYQHWHGRLSGHGWRWLAVTRHGVRGLLRSWVVRLLLVAAWLPAIVLVTALALWGLLEQQAESVLTFLQRLLPPEVIASPQDYRSAIWTVAFAYFFKAELFGSLFLVLVVGPNLISRDLRFNALPLYLSRPLRRADYLLGKLGVIGFFLAATAVGPAVAAYLLGVGFSLDLGVVRDTHRLLWAGAAYGLVVTVSAGTLMLALSALSRRSIYVGLAWAGLVFLTHMLSTALIGINGDAERRAVVQGGLRSWVADHPPPAGVDMNGPYPVRRFIPPPPRPAQAAPPQTAEEKARERWHRDWSAAYAELQSRAEADRLERGRTDWRPTLSYATNLDRMGDALLGTDAAWELLGRTVERPRAAFGPLVKGRGVPLPAGPANDRLLADRMVWQFPWVWSAGALGGVWLLSVAVLSRRVKSLDRLQ